MRNIHALFFIIALTFASCATTEKPVTNTTNNYSTQTEKEFSRIESDEAQILEKYRRMREANWNSYVKPSGESNAARYMHQRSPEPQKTITPPPKPTPAPLSEEAIRNIEVEIGQRKSIFCMKAKTVKRYDSESDCQAYVEDAHYQCVQKYGENNYSLLNCVRTRLK